MQDGGIHATDAETLAKLLHGDREPVTQETNQETQMNNDPVPGPAIYEEMQPLRSKEVQESKKKGTSCACAVF